MKKHTTPFVGILFIFSLLVLVACSTKATPTEITPLSPTIDLTPIPETYTDPFTYCAAMGTADTPDERYTGPQINAEIINGFLAAAGLEGTTEPMEMLEQTTIWRCMDGQVYACNFGANLPCASKANSEETPTAAMSDYCKANPDSDFIPMSETGHDTIYSWRCAKDVPILNEQIAEVDAAGYLADIWYPILPNAGHEPEISATPFTALESTLSPTPVPPLAGLSGQILFSSNRAGVYSDLYLLDLTSVQLTRLTSGDSNVFAGPISPDGNQVLYTGFGLTHSFVGLMNIDGSQSQDLSQSPDSDEGFPAWSPDGRTIAFTSRRDGNNEIYLMNADGSNLKRLTNHPADDFAPAWSPDGKQIAFVSDRDNSAGVYNLYLMNADGSNIQRLTVGPEIDYQPIWSPDGNWIAFRAHHDGPADIYLIKPDGSDLVNLTNNPAEDWAPAWSPDGSLLAFQTNRDGNWEIYVIHADGSNPIDITQDSADDQMPYWAP